MNDNNPLTSIAIAAMKPKRENIIFSFYEYKLEEESELIFSKKVKCFPAKNADEAYAYFTGQRKINPDVCAIVECAGIPGMTREPRIFISPSTAFFEEFTYRNYEHNEIYQGDEIIQDLLSNP